MDKESEEVGSVCDATLTSDDAVDGLFEVFAIDGRVQMPGSDQRRLVADVSDVGS